MMNVIDLPVSFRRNPRTETVAYSDITCTPRNSSTAHGGNVSMDNQSHGAFLHRGKTGTEDIQVSRSRRRLLPPFTSRKSYHTILHHGDPVKDHMGEDQSQVEHLVPEGRRARQQAFSKAWSRSFLARVARTGV